MRHALRKQPIRTRTVFAASLLLFPAAGTAIITLVALVAGWHPSIGMYIFGSDEIPLSWPQLLALLPAAIVTALVGALAWMGRAVRLAFAVSLAWVLVGLGVFPLTGQLNVAFGAGLAAALFEPDAATGSTN